MTKKQNRGAISIIFLAVVALILILILAATQSQLLLSLRRSQSATDILVATYEAESEVNDIMAQLLGGYIDSADINTTKNIGNVRLEIEGNDMGNTQIITVTAFRGLAVGKVQAVRRISTVEEVNDVQIVLMLDCTQSMDANSGTPGQTRFNAQEEAAVDFINRIAEHKDADKFKVGVGVFGVDAAWLTYNGRETTPDSGLSFSEISAAIEDSFGDTRAESQCGSKVINATSVGTAFRFGHDFLKTTENSDTKQIEIVITDGEPNSRIQDAECPPDIQCILNCEDEAKDYLRCAAADTNTYVSEIGQDGVRSPEVDAYAVTIFRNPPADVVSIFRNYATEGGYFNATEANQLTEILDNLLTGILESNSSVTIKRIVPEAQ